MILLNKLSLKTIRIILIVLVALAVLIYFTEITIILNYIHAQK